MTHLRRLVGPTLTVVALGLPSSVLLLAAHGAHAQPAASASASARPAPRASGSGSAGNMWEGETPAQRTRRLEYTRTFATKARETAMANNKVWTKEGSAAYGKFWSLAMRLIRVRDLAESDGDKATAERASASLKKSEDWVLAQLTEHNAKAPVRKGPPPFGSVFGLPSPSGRSSGSTFGVPSAFASASGSSSGRPFPPGSAAGRPFKPGSEMAQGRPAPSASSQGPKK